MKTLSILELTADEFSSQVYDILGKGRQHALAYYQAFFQKGDGLMAFDPKEKQAESLFQKIHNLVTLPCYDIKIKQDTFETQKYVLEFSDKLIAELVVIPMKEKLTLCISSQVGCGMGCAFCETGRMGRLRHLKVEEILLQVHFAKQVLKKPIHNIVFMGMGEPFDNFESVVKALDILTDPLGMNMGPSRITVSTSGIVPRILDFIPMGQKGVKLAISVNGATDEVRQKIMPINRRYNMQTLKEALKAFTTQTKKQVLAEYVLLDGINDRKEDSQALSAYLKEIPCTINLIPYNAQSSSRFAPPAQEKIKEFQKDLLKDGFKVFVRQNKGDKIMAACGQLGQLSLKKSALKNS